MSSSFAESSVKRLRPAGEVARLPGRDSLTIALTDAPGMTAREIADGSPE